jgi:hypothetical protein
MIHGTTTDLTDERSRRPLPQHIVVFPSRLRLLTPARADRGRLLNPGFMRSCRTGCLLVEDGDAERIAFDAFVGSVPFAYTISSGSGCAGAPIHRIRAVRKMRTNSYLILLVVLS